MVASVPDNSACLKFNKSGLYHFEGNMYLEISSSGALNYLPEAEISFWINNHAHSILSTSLNNTSAVFPTTQFNKNVN